jgi:hypothetical protein
MLAASGYYDDIQIFTEGQFSIWRAVLKCGANQTKEGEKKAKGKKQKKNEEKKEKAKEEVEGGEEDLQEGGAREGFEEVDDGCGNVFYIKIPVEAKEESVEAKEEEAKEESGSKKRKCDGAGDVATEAVAAAMVSSPLVAAVGKKVKRLSQKQRKLRAMQKAGEVEKAQKADTVIEPAAVKPAAPKSGAAAKDVATKLVSGDATSDTAATIQAKMEVITQAIQNDDYSRAGELAGLQARLDEAQASKRNEKSEKKVSAGLTAVQQAQAEVTAITQAIKNDDYSRAGELAGLQARLDEAQARKNDEKKIFAVQHAQAEVEAITQAIKNDDYSRAGELAGLAAKIEAAGVTGGAEAGGGKARKKGKTDDNAEMQKRKREGKEEKRKEKKGRGR